MSRHIDKEALVTAVMSSTELDNEQKSQLIRLIREQKKYGLVWEDSTEDAWEQLKTQIPILKEVDDKRILNDKEGELYPNHAIIEADNLHALVSLCYTHAGMIDVIYIDPPYNTGNKDFAYYDDFEDEYRQIPYVDREDSYRHSKWLSFMDKRLRIAKTLLSDKGVIFISIDDNEQAQLKNLCDEIFNSHNYVATFVWVKKKKGSHLSKTTRSMTEYVLCYTKDLTNLEMYGENAYSDKQQPLAKRTNAIKQLSFDKNIIHTTLADGCYGGVQGKGSSSLFFDEFEVKGNLVISPCIVSGPFIWTQAKLDEEIKMGTTINLSSKFGFNVLRSDQETKIKRPSTLIDSKVEVGTNEDAYDELIAIFGEEGVMSYPKPVSLIRYLLNTRAFYNKDLTILDFFAGSGTTLHATMQLNAEDGGHRQCILVTNNENNICEEVTYERNKRVIEGYTTPKGEQVAGLSHNNLRYYKLDFTPREKTDKNMLSLAIKSIPLLCIKNDIYQEAPQLGRIANTQKGYRYFKEGDRRMLVILDTDLIGDIVKELERMEVTNPIKTYVFTTGHYPFTEDFQSVSNKVDLYPIPHSIYGACEKHMPPMEDKELEQPEGIVLTAEEENLSMDDYNKED